MIIYQISQNVVIITRHHSHLKRLLTTTVQRVRNYIHNEKQS